MTFARHFVAALMAVAVVVAIGLAWEHSGAASFVGGGGHAGRVIIYGAPPGNPAASPDQIKLARTGHGGRVPGLSPSHLANLIQTVAIECAIATVVIVIDVFRRRRKRMQPRIRSGAL